jgi:hypothetical protein
LETLRLFCAFRHKTKAANIDPSLSAFRGALGSKALDLWRRATLVDPQFFADSVAQAIYKPKKERAVQKQKRQRRTAASSRN